MIGLLKSSFVAIAACLMLAGCMGEKKLPQVDVSGQVLLNNEPFSGAAVRFFNPELGGGAFNLNEQGEFTSSSPVTVGEYMVSLDQPGPVDGETPSDIKWPEDRTKELPKDYRSVAKSGLTAYVSVEGENHFVFRLEGGAPRGKEGEGPEFIEPLAGR